MDPGHKYILGANNLALSLTLAMLVLAGLLGTPARAQLLDADEIPLWEEVDLAKKARRDSLLALGSEIKEPLFAFLVAAASDDSLGTWHSADLAGMVAAGERTSRFPLDLIRRLSRRRPRQAENLGWPSSQVMAVWEIELKEELDVAPPVQHPGLPSR
jgi:hypothetical protein